MDEELQKNIELIEKEKQEFLNGTLDESGEDESDSEEEEETEEQDVNVDEMEFGLTEDEIEEWIAQLTKLKEEKGFVELDVDEENSLKINFEESSMEELEEDEE